MAIPARLDISRLSSPHRSGSRHLLLELATSLIAAFRRPAELANRNTRHNISNMNWCNLACTAIDIHTRSQSWSLSSSPACLRISALAFAARVSRSGASAAFGLLRLHTYVQRPADGVRTAVELPFQHWRVGSSHGISAQPRADSDAIMIWTYLLILSVVQGITEFLPISSSAHLILVRDLFLALGVPVSEGGAADELALDIALHVGSLGAILLYFRKDVTQLFLGLADAVRLRPSDNARMLMLLTVATMPIIVAGFLLKDIVTYMLRSVEIIAWMTIIFGVLLYVAGRNSDTPTAQPKRISARRSVAVWPSACAHSGLQPSEIAYEPHAHRASTPLSPRFHWLCPGRPPPGAGTSCHVTPIGRNPPSADRRAYRRPFPRRRLITVAGSRKCCSAIVLNPSLLNRCPHPARCLHSFACRQVAARPSSGPHIRLSSAGEQDMPRSADASRIAPRLNYPHRAAPPGGRQASARHGDAVSKSRRREGNRAALPRATTGLSRPAPPTISPFTFQH